MARDNPKRGMMLLFDCMEMIEGMLDKEEQADIYADIRRYALEGKTGRRHMENKVYRSLLKMLCSTQDEMAARYEQTCERNRQSIRRRWQKKAEAEAGAEAEAEAETEAQDEPQNELQTAPEAGTDAQASDTHVYARMHADTQHTKEKTKEEKKKEEKKREEKKRALSDPPCGGAAAALRGRKGGYDDGIPWYD